ncbi:NADase-type glycan-binding domain-containing protein [Acidipropionibacterium timonense]|uniref:NADase-type glycan-binding domain-containing protein n=1 Tax=Acidipropionibacterium timonense TaxID=2161818 RepID=UPI001030FCA1|nr:hypothetical protein [Acidipropionibacterium timonense]
MATNLPDDWFRPTEDEVSGEGRQEEVSTPPTVATEGTARDPETTGRMRIDLDEHGASVVIGSSVAAPSVSRPRRRRHVPVWVLWVALALAVGLAAGTLVHNSVLSSVPSVALDQPAAGPASSAGEAPWQGASHPVTGMTATASCTADPQPGSGGGLVSYEASNLVDGKEDTAWRCDGSATGQRITLTVPQGTKVVGVGLVNGYSKTVGDQDLYRQYRRVLKVRWSMPDGSWFTQDLTDDIETMQTVMIRPVVVRGPILMTIISSSQPGRPGEPTRDAVLISSVQVLAAS